jgi:hypothetical protein
VDEPDGNGVEVVELASAVTAGRDQVGPFQDVEVAHDAEAGHRRQVGTQLADRLRVSLEEAIEQQPAARIGQRAEHKLHSPNNM